MDLLLKASLLSPGGHPRHFVQRRRQISRNEMHVGLTLKLGYNGVLDGDAYARHQQSQRIETSGKPTQSNAQGTPSGANAKNGNANGSGRSG
jgi:hypothetical protein